mgnify:CR=1 FL=1
MQRIEAVELVTAIETSGDDTLTVVLPVGVTRQLFMVDNCHTYAQVANALSFITEAVTTRAEIEDLDVAYPIGTWFVSHQVLQIIVDQCTDEEGTICGADLVDHITRLLNPED